MLHEYNMPLDIYTYSLTANAISFTVQTQSAQMLRRACYVSPNEKFGSAINRPAAHSLGNCKYKLIEFNNNITPVTSEEDQ